MTRRDIEQKAATLGLVRRTERAEQAEREGRSSKPKVRTYRSVDERVTDMYGMAATPIGAIREIEKHLLSRASIPEPTKVLLLALLGMLTRTEELAYKLDMLDTKVAAALKASADGHAEFRSGRYSR